MAQEIWEISINFVPKDVQIILSSQNFGKVQQTGGVLYKKLYLNFSQ